MTGTDMGSHHIETGLISSNIGQHPSEHGVVKKSQNKNNISNDNQIYDIRNNILWERTPWIFTQLGRHLIPKFSIFCGAPPDMGISVNNNCHWEMVQNFVPWVHKDSVQKKQ